MSERFKTLWRALTGFSDREGRRVLLLLPLLAVICLLFVWQGRPRSERGLMMYVDRVRADRTAHGSEARRGVAVRRDSLFAFDPNRVSGAELVQLGFTEPQAAGIIHYREAGARFCRAEDFARCYTVSPEQFARLRPYIQIARSEEVVSASVEVDRSTRLLSPRSLSSNESTLRLFEFDPNRVSGAELVQLGFTERQAAGIVRYREAGARFRRVEDFARCYTVSPEQFARLRPYIRIDRVPSEKVSSGTVMPQSSRPSPLSGRVERLELNGADSAQLVAIRGIGSLTAGRIVHYRDRLGGFASVGQLCEVQGMTEQNYEMILQQIWVDSSKIQKIDINFATPLSLRDHPYLTERILNRLLKYRQLKGGWRTIGDLTEQHIFSEEQAAKIAPYLKFHQP